MLRKPKNDKNTKHLAQARSSLQEKSIVNTLNAELVRGSGRGHDKGDVKIKNVLKVECKNTKKSSFSINLEMLEKMRKMCNKNEVGFIQVDFIDQDGYTLDQIIITDLSVLKEYTAMKGIEFYELN